MIRVALASDIDAESVVAVPLPPTLPYPRREALVLRDRGGVLRAYVNRCRHLPIPLDGGSRRFLDDARQYFMCGTHGALFRKEDGHCIVGPCRGQSLLALGLRVDEDGVVWIDPHEQQIR